MKWGKEQAAAEEFSRDIFTTTSDHLRAEAEHNTSPTKEEKASALEGSIGAVLVLAGGALGWGLLLSQINEPVSLESVPLSRVSFNPASPV